jgi:hypothetical protein
MGDGDTHLCQLAGVTALSICGLSFGPRRLGRDGDRLHLPGRPPDPGQVCATCLRAERSGR